ncbi:MAG TPA: cytochrome C oxidase subunit IV family protein [Candidatus Eisenbacteria bacterium]|nr:cytochrome C oxidase subunit IV family protein [Candidatus Eisenbacteria bacterium]
MSAHAEAHGAHHRNYVKIWAILSGLLVVSVIGPMFGIRVVTIVTAFGIALVKAYLVAKNFMHLDIEKPIVKWLLSLALIIMVLLYTMVAPDVEKSSGQHWVKDKGFHHVRDGAGKSHGHEPKKENQHGSDHR